MDWPRLSLAALSPSPQQQGGQHLPLLAASERILIQIPSLTARRGKHTDLFSGPVTVVLTSYRAVLIVPATPRPAGYELGLHLLEDVKDISKGGFFAAQRIAVQLKFSSNSDDSVCLIFSSTLVKDEFLRHAQRAIQDRLWASLDLAAPATSLISPSSSTSSTSDSPAASPGDSTTDGSSSSSGSSSALTGIARIQQDQTSRLAQAAAVTHDAARDLDSLMAHAQAVVRLVDSYALYLTERDQATGTTNTDTATGTATGTGTGTGTAAGAGSDEGREMEAILQSIGMVSPVTRLQAGREYHRQLAEQLASLLHEVTPPASASRLARVGGMLTLPEAYCWYNRARGTELVSPDDLHAAAQALALLPHLGLALKRFPSGVLVIQLSSLSDGEMAARLVHLCSERPGPGQGSGREGEDEGAGEARSPLEEYRGLAAPDMQRRTGLSLALCREQLSLAEARGLLCRDESAAEKTGPTACLGLQPTLAF